MSLWSSKKAPSDCEAQCPDCGVILSRHADINRHRKTKHPDGTETKFPCPWFGCGYEATQKGNLKSHVDARHSDGPKFPCPECARRFTDAAARIRHRKKLHGYVPYHTKEYLARQAHNRKERVVQRTGKAVSNSNQSHRQQVLPNASPNASSSVPPSAPKLTEVAYHDDFWKMPVDVTHLYSPQPLPLSLPFESWPGYNTPNFIQDFPSATQSPPLYLPQPLSSQGALLSSPFETWPGYVTPNSIQSAAQSPPSLTPSDFTIDCYSDLLHGPQLHTMQSQEQQFEESLSGDHGMPPYNWNGQWNWQLQ